MYRYILITFFLFISGSVLVGQPTFVPVDLKTEHLENPIGIDNPRPRLSWRIDSQNEGTSQSAYDIVVGTDSLAVSRGEGNHWRSGKTVSNDRLVSYSGKELDPFTKYFWKAVLWDERAQQSASAVYSFETGMIETRNWQGNWISDGSDIHYQPASFFRKPFTAGKEIRSARVYIAVGGLYELYINGEKIGDQRLDPMYTRYDRRNLYVTHDVTASLAKGMNVVGVLLGNGWYNHQSKAVWDFDRAPWRNRPAFCLDLRITYADGSTDIIPSDLSWRKSDSPLLFNSIYTGEHYDARREQEGWSKTGFDDSRWQGVVLRAAPSSHITAQQIRPIRNVRQLSATSINRIDQHTFVYDLGQNMAGVTRLRVAGPEGTVVNIKHGERLYENGRVDLSNIDVYYRGNMETEPFQTDILTLSGKGEDEFMARFNYKGFRYVEVTATQPVELDQNSLTAFFMHSDVPPIGKIHTSSSLINKLWQATNNAYLSNLMGYPTDCPQREKNGWTGDGHFAIETGLYNFDGITIYEKWLADHRDEQQPNGVLPDIIPTGGWGYGTANGLDWTSTIAIIPWNLYLFYGDTKPLADCYDNIRRYVDYVDRSSPEHLTSWGRGDWVPVKSLSNLELTSSVYFYVDTHILAEAAKLFDREDDYKHYSTLANNIKNAINRKYLDRETGIYATGTQTELSVPLQWKVVPEEMIPLVARNLSKKVEEADYHLDVGVLGAKAILNALSENGYPETAYKVAVQDSYPSWGWWIVNGATTLLENWDLEAERDISDNHMMFGEIGAWFFKGLGGIFPDPVQPGFKNIILRPHFIRNLDHFEAQFQSPYGLIKSKWRWEKRNLVIYEVTVPANSVATLQLPESVTGNKNFTLEAGNHILYCKVKPEKKKG